MRKSRGDVEIIEAVSAHIEKHIGKIALVLHEKESPHVHVDVHIVEPTSKRPFKVVVTSGMSERPMPVPDGTSDGRYAELAICLPPDWPVSSEAFQKEENWWPFRLLKELARYPHVEKTWLYAGHSMCWYDPSKPFAPNTRMTSVMLLRPKLFAPQAHIIHLGEDKHALLCAVFPLYDEELELKLRDGSERLERLFEKNGITELLDPRRPSVVRPN
jgi:hypothetical protein